MKIIPRSLAFDMLFGSNSGEAHCVIDEIYEKFEAKIQELELIIKGKYVIIESMEQGKSCRTCVYAGAYTMGWMPCMNESVGGMFKYGVNDNFGCKFYKHMHEPKENQDVK